MWKKIPCSFSDLNLDITLGGGQAFRWIKTDNNEWLGVISNLVYTVKQDSSGNLLYTCKGSDSSINILPPKKRKRAETKSAKSNCTPKTNLDEENPERTLKNYLNLDVDLNYLYKTWSECDENFNAVAKEYKGIRILCQDPLENLFSFICSANNNIPRITSMVDKLCLHYGTRIASEQNRAFYTFPDAGLLATDSVEEKLRDLGFGYRAKYINQTAKALVNEKPSGWLEGLRSLPYKEAHEALMTLPGVGAKVADCICLMSLHKYEAIPVDTHIWQVTVKNYMPQLKVGKTLTHRLYQEIGDFYRQRFGDYAGWANTVLFAADLKMFKTEGKKS